MSDQDKVVKRMNAVIVTGMDMPIDCADKCKCKLECKNFYYMKGERPRLCPLKSTEGLIDAVSNVYVNMIGSADDTELSCLVRVIKEYCEVSE